MGRAIWKGNISFGLVSVPVELFSTVQDKSVRFHMLTKDGKCRLRQKLYCPETGKEYDYSQTAKGYEVEPENYVILEKKELDALKPESGRSIDITDFVALEDIDPLYFERGYYLAPDERSVKAYQLLHQSMLQAGKVAVAKFVMRQKEYLTVIRPLEKVLCMETMHYQEELVPVSAIPNFDLLDKKGVKVGPKELKIADQLIDAMTVDFEPEKYTDEYTERLRDLIDAKAKGKKFVPTEAKDERSAKVIDLMDALKKSLGTKKQKAPRAAATKRSTKKRASSR